MTPGVNRLRLVALVAFFAAVTMTANSASPLPAFAATGDGITAYISPPFVQGPPSNIAPVAIENFNGANFCTNFPSSAVGTFSGTCTTIHTSHNEFKFGGANTTSHQPTVGGTSTQFVAAFSGQQLNLSFPDQTPARYVGFWWSAGSGGNKVRFYSKASGSEALIAEFTTDAINTLLYTGGTVQNSVRPPNPYPGDQFLTALDESQYNKGYYFGRPSNHSSLTPTSMPFTDENQNIYSHAYLSVFASGSASFSKVEFIGPGFEFDNVAISSEIQTPSPELVLLQSVLGKSADFRANGGTGSMPAQTSNAATTLSPNTFTRNGFTFAGWSTSPTGSVEYTDGANYGFATDLTLYAVWTENPSTATTTPEEIVAPTTTTSATTPPAATETTSSASVEVLAVTSLPKTGSSLTPAWLIALSLLTVGWIVTRLRRRILT